MNNRQKLVQQQYLNNEKAVLRQLKKSYTDSLVAINDTVKNLQLSIDGLQQEYDWMDDDDPQKAIVKSKIQSKIYQKQYQEQLQSQVGGILSEMQRSQFVTVSDYLDKCYEDGFIGSIFDLHGQGVPLTMPINQESMVKAVQLDSKISKGLYTKLGEDVDLLKKRITSEVTRAIATGSTYAQTAQRLAGQTKIGYNKAARIARTEGHRIQNSAADDAAHLARDRGADVVKQWDATLDGNTRESHVAVDGQIRELDEEFGNGLMFPGDPRGSAAEVVNCRCAYLQRARWAVGGSFTKMNNFTGQLETFDSPQDYDEFKKAFFSSENKKYMNYVEQMQGKYGTKDFATVLGSMTDREYKHYSNLLKGNPLFNTKADVGDSFSVRGMKKPVRPKRRDFQNEDAYQSALESHRKQRTEYDDSIDSVVKSELEKERQYASYDALRVKAESLGIDISGLDDHRVDDRIFDDVLSVHEELFSKYPQVKAFQDQYRQWGLYAEGDNSYLFEAGAGLKFGKVWDDYEAGIREVFDGITGGFLTMGDGTVKTAIRHEFGHNVDGYIKSSLSGNLDLRRQYVSELCELTKKHCTTEYAFVNDCEAFAEGFAEYTSNPSSEYGKAFGEFMGRWLK